MGPEAAILFKDNIVGYIAGWIVKSVLSKFDCVMCKELCYTFDKHYAHPTANKLTMIRDYGTSLVLPTKAITDLCILIDREIAIFEKIEGGCIYLDKLFDLKIFSRVVKKSNFQQLIPTIDSHDSSHRIKLVKFIISKYVKLKKSQATNKINTSNTTYEGRRLRLLANFVESNRA